MNLHNAYCINATLHSQNIISDMHANLTFHQSAHMISYTITSQSV